jgi:F-type H+-transporting ATPase subunit b
MEKLIPNWTLIVQLVMFLTAMFILTRLLFRPMLAVFALRAQYTERPHQDAAKLRENATSAKETVEQGLNRARKEVDQLRGELAGKAAAQEHDILIDARRKSAESVEAARRDLDAAASAARARLAAEAEELAETLATKLVEVQR